MRATTMTTLVLVTMLAAVRPASADDRAALEAARGWYAVMLETGLRLAKQPPGPPEAALAVAAPPVVMAVYDRWKSCKGFAPSRARRAPSVGQLARCMAVLDRNGRSPAHTAADFGVATLDQAVASIGARFKRSQRARVVSQLRRDARGATIVRAWAGGLEFVMTFMVVGPDGAIRAVWVVEDVAEMVPDSPSQTVQ